MAGVIRVCNWSRFQHYGKRRPPWIKLYRDVLVDYDVMGLEPEERWCLIGLWLIASETDNEIPADPDWLARRLSITFPPPIARLQTLGFITLDENASNALAKRYRKKRRVREEKSTDVRVRSGYPDSFEQLWMMHRRGAKKKAFEEYQKVVGNGVTHEEIAAGLSSYVKTLRPDFQGAHLFRWIRDHRWEEAPVRGRRSADPYMDMMLDSERHAE